MIWLLGNNLDFEGAAKVQQMRSPLLELTAIFSEDHTDWFKYYISISKSVLKIIFFKFQSDSIGDSLDFTESLPTPRFIKSHLPLELLPTDLTDKKPKVRINKLLIV